MPARMRSNCMGTAHRSRRATPGSNGTAIPRSISLALSLPVALSLPAALSLPVIKGQPRPRPRAPAARNGAFRPRNLARRPLTIAYRPDRLRAPAAAPPQASTRASMPSLPDRGAPAWRFWGRNRRRHGQTNGPYRAIIGAANTGLGGIRGSRDGPAPRAGKTRGYSRYPALLLITLLVTPGGRR